MYMSQQVPVLLPEKLYTYSQEKENDVQLLQANEALIQAYLSQQHHQHTRGYLTRDRYRHEQEDPNSAATKANKSVSVVYNR